MEHKKIVHGVFEGGGVKGTGLVGALAITEELGYQFSHVAGTSAGAIVAALVAAGYTATQLKNILDELDYTQFKDKTILSKLPLLGKGMSLLFHDGFYKGDYFESWLKELLAAKNIKTFDDLRVLEKPEQSRFTYKLQIVTSDISNGRLVVLPEDAALYSLDPSTLSVARAVRMSMSIPFFYTPVTLRDLQHKQSYFVDGGILSNFPVWIFDPEAGATTSLCPTFGYKLVDPDEDRPHKITGPLSLLSALFSTMLEAHDARYIKDTNFMRTIPIETIGVQTTDFDISVQKRNELYESGRQAAISFFDKWDFGTYNQERIVPHSRRKDLWHGV